MRELNMPLIRGRLAILMMNDDTYFEDNYIETIVKISEENPGAVIGSLDITREEPRRIFFSGVEKMIWWKAKGINYHDGYDLYDPAMTGLHKSVCLNGRGTLVPVEVFDTIGLLDEEKLPQYASDFDFSLRADEAGIDTFISWDASQLFLCSEDREGQTLYQAKVRCIFTQLLLKILTNQPEHQLRLLQKTLQMVLFTFCIFFPYVENDLFILQEEECF